MFAKPEIAMGLIGCLLAADFAVGQQSPEEKHRPIVRKSIEQLSKELGSKDYFQEHSSWANAWEVVTDHFRVKTTRSFAFGWELGQAMEQLLPELAVFAPGQDWSQPFGPAQKFPIYIFPDLDSYNNYGNSINADAHSSVLGSHYGISDPELPVASYFYYDKGAGYIYLWVAHSVTHQFLHRAYPNQTVQGVQTIPNQASPLPLWIDEGLPCYISVLQNYQFALRRVAFLAANDRLIPFQEYERLSIADFNDDRFYQLGVFLYFLLHVHEKTKTSVSSNGEILDAPFVEYLRAFLQNENAEGLEVAASLRGQALREIESEFLRYLSDIE